MVIIQASNKG